MEFFFIQSMRGFLTFLPHDAHLLELTGVAVNASVLIPFSRGLADTEK